MRRNWIWRVSIVSSARHPHLLPSPAIYVARIKAFVSGFETYPERGSIRDHVRPGLRIVGFERRVSVAFVVEPTEVVILRILYAGQRFESDES